MFNVRFTGLLAFCAALAACDRPTPSPEITAPPPGAPSFDAAAAADAGLVPYDLNILVTDDAAAQQAATGGRASGHADAISFGADRRYSFTALSIATPPAFDAKGNVEFHTAFAGGQGVGKGDVLCMRIVGNRARIAALWTSFRVNNVEMPIPPGQNLIWTVEDNGEGANAPQDRASPIFQTSTAGGPFHCAVGAGLPLVPNDNGNIQVKAQ